MIYLDYSATTPADERVLTAFTKFNLEHFGNPNSNHELGILANHHISKSTKEILEILNVQDYEVVYTSGATEANNLALKGYALANSHKGHHIITSPYEHSSVTSCLNYLAKNGFDVDILELDKNGLIDIKNLEKLITDETILVSIALVNSELGILQDLDGIKEVLRKHPDVCFHSDITQALGKIKFDLNGIDLVSFSGHKIYGLKGIGALLRKKPINLIPVIHGGRSTSILRGGTPPAPLINSLSLALRFVYQDLDKKYSHVQELRRFLIEDLLPDCPHVSLNYKEGIPHIINLSFLNIPASTLHKELSKRHIYISTQTACNSESSFSDTVKRLTGSDKNAASSIRVSLSYLTKKAELVEFVKAVKEVIHADH